MLAGGRASQPAIAFVYVPLISLRSSMGQHLLISSSLRCHLGKEGEKMTERCFGQVSPKRLPATIPAVEGDDSILVW